MDTPKPKSTMPEPQAQAALDAVPQEPQELSPMIQDGLVARPEADNLWDYLDTFTVNERHLESNRIVTATRRDPCHAAFDVLRTKILQTLRDNGWSRVAITSPTANCGKTFMSVNLALSFSRQLNCRTMLLDFDMRHPSVAKVLGISEPGSMGELLRNEAEAEDVLLRPGRNDLKIGANLAVGANGRREDYASELLQQPMTSDILDDLEEELEPDVMLFDMPPVLVNDDVLAARPLYDAVLLVVGGGITKPQEVRLVEQRLGTETPLLGIVLNRSEGVSSKVYSY
ncbi:MAG: CpsD/CapB family tyrosine-protein kinase [Marinovum sp.]|nr:CpsD/CapB family tyrosine-protein kinase [Marinovum sp.]